MLVLSRKVNEQIQIGDAITITVVRLSPNSVRIGVDAPPHLMIVRDELNDTVLSAVTPPDDDVASATSSNMGERD
ncbi:MAG TPA: carbon storage regulator [Pirellulales bacterium]|jgi:carbon storage regulator|nr:carbon storage regulator [Pirellulales bacterium]